MSNTTNETAAPKRNGRPPIASNVGPGEKTPQRQVRIPDEVWYAAAAKAIERGTTASAVVRELLAEWVERG